MAAQLRRPVTGFEGIIGQTAVVRQPLEPEGMVLAEGELWRAESESGPVAVGEKVVVVGRDGYCLRVQRSK